MLITISFEKIILDNKSNYNKLKQDYYLVLTLNCKFTINQMSLEIPEFRFDLKTPGLLKTDDEFTIWFLEGILEKYPSYVECLMLLGNAYTGDGMYEKGLKVDLKLARLRPDDPLVRYNLACSFSLLGRFKQALESLGKAIDLGYNDLHHLEDDSDLDSLREEDDYKLLIDKLKRSTTRLV
jgi:tetratricopeptide (TPR) repeat protein